MRYSFILSMSIISSMSATAQAEPFGRLFITPLERAKLDQWRKQGDHDQTPAEGDRGPVQATEEHLTLNGYVTRSSGKVTAWINRTPHTEDDPTENVTVLQQQNRAPVITLHMPSGKKINLKAGETLDIQTGVVHEMVDPAEIEIVPSSVKKP